MLTLSPDQLSSLGASAHARFLARLDEFLSRHFPDKLADLAGERKQRFFDEALRRAAEHNVKSEIGVCLFAALVLTVGYARTVHLIGLYARDGAVDMEEVFLHARHTLPEGEPRG